MKSFTRLILLCLSAMLIITSCKKDDSEPKKYTLTVTANPTNGGTVTGSGDYNSGEDVALTATANAEYNFVNWKNGDEVVSTEANFTYKTTSNNVTLIANFAVKTYHLSLNITTPAGSAVVTGGGDYQPGTNVEITATANSGWVFENWTKGITEISSVSNFTYTTTAEDVTLSANFSPAFILTLAVSPVNSGTVTGGGSYKAGTNVSITATPSIGYTFVNWTNGGLEVSTNPSFSYSTALENETLTANFTENTYLITLGAQSHASIGSFYSIAKNLIYNLTDATNNQTDIDLIGFYEVANGNNISIASPGATITGIFPGDFASWTTKRLTLLTPPASAITTTQFDALHQNDPSIQNYFNSGMTSGNKKAKQLAVDNIYAFKTQDNVYGLFKVTNVVQGADGSVQVVLKFRK